MAITRWDPFGEMLKMQRDMDRIFSRMGTQETGQGSGTVAWMPRINVKRSGDDLAVNVELAGIKPEDVSVEVTDGVLTLSGERKAEEERQDEGWMIRESSYGSFERSIVLPEGVDASSIQANFHDGMLEIHVPKALQAAKPETTKVEINTIQHGSQNMHTQTPAEGERAEGEGDGHPEAQATPPEQQTGEQHPQVQAHH